MKNLNAKKRMGIDTGCVDAIHAVLGSVGIPKLVFCLCVGYEGGVRMMIYSGYWKNSRAVKEFLEVSMLELRRTDFLKEVTEDVVHGVSSFGPFELSFVTYSFGNAIRIDIFLIRIWDYRTVIATVCPAIIIVIPITNVPGGHHRNGMFRQFPIHCSPA